MPEDATLDEHTRDFTAQLASFKGFTPRRSFGVDELRSDSNWPWAAIYGVYCFVRHGDVVYVGRALGETIGERLWDQLRSLGDPDWSAVVLDPETRVEVIEVDKDRVYLAAALEAYLIDRIKPRFNLRAC